MSPRSGVRTDLIVLVPGIDDERAMTEVLRRHQSLGIRPIDFEMIRDTLGADPGCYGRSHELLQPSLREFEHALVIFDRQGSGQESRGVEELEREVGERLRQNGWADRAAVIVIDPELEAWIWGSPRKVGQTLGWHARPESLREWLHGEGLWSKGSPKPSDPKEAFEQTLRALNRRRSSGLFRKLAKEVSLERCRDRSFCRLVRILRSWFPPAEGGE